MALANPLRMYFIPQRFLNGLSLKEGSAVRWALAHLKAKDPNLAPRAVVALTDAAATLTAAQIVESGIFTITPGADRVLTPPTAAQLIAALYPDGYGAGPAGASCEFSIVCLAAFNATVTAGANVTVVGVAAVNNVSGTFRVVIDSATTAKIYRI